METIRVVSDEQNVVVISPLDLPINVAQLQTLVGFVPVLVWTGNRVVFDSSRSNELNSPRLSDVQGTIFVYSESFVSSKGGSRFVIPKPVRDVIEKFCQSASEVFTRGRAIRLRAQQLARGQTNQQGSDFLRQLLAQGSSKETSKEEQNSLRSAQKIFNDIKTGKKHMYAMDAPELLEKIEKISDLTFDAFFPLFKEFEVELGRRRNAMADPTSAEGQKLIQRQIDRERIENQLSSSYEHHPESLVPVTMLYINLTINGYPVKGFIDSGAQISIMSEACAKRCNLDGFIDRRFRALTKGVGGTERTVGKIHMCDVKVENSHYAFWFDVLANRDMDLLIGLNVLRRHNCCINLASNRLEFGDGNTTPFLQDTEISHHLRDVVGIDQEEEMDTDTGKP